MCRHLGYLGPARPLAELLLDPEHSLRVQAYAPADMRCPARMNADGFGFGWYSGATPRRYRRACPMWHDANLAALTGEIQAGAVLAAVRSATPGMPLAEAACAPLASGPWLFSHNGMLTGWPAAATTLAAKLAPEELLTMEAGTDSALLWVLLARRLAAGEPADAALAAVVTEAEEAAPGSRLNFLLTDGARVYATTWRQALWVRHTGAAVTVASERLDGDDGWAPVEDGQVLVADAQDWKLTPLVGPEPANRLS